MTYPVRYETRSDKVWGLSGIALMVGIVVFMWWWNHRARVEVPVDPTPHVDGYTTVAAEHGIYLLVPEEIQLEEPEEQDYGY